MRVYGFKRFAALAWAALGCAPAPQQGSPSAAVEAPQLVAAPLELAAPPQSDAVPRWALAFAYADGRTVPIAERAIGYAPFRDGVALLDVQRRLLLISPDGSRRVLSSTTATTPVRGPSGELYYTARYGTVTELHRLTEAGSDAVIARELSSIALLEAQADDSVLLVGARNGGVAGLWRIGAREHAASCLTNCELKTGEPWGDRFVPPPGSAAELLPAYRALQTIDGEQGTTRGKP